MRKRTAAPDPSSPSRVARLGVVLSSRTGRVLRTALCAAAALLVLSLVLRQARASVSRQPAYRLGAGSVQFIDLPAWVEPSMRAQLEAPGLIERLRTGGSTDSRLASTLPPLSIFEPGIERRLKEILATHPMVLEVRDLEVRFPGEVRAWVVLRTPVALVRTRV